MQVHVSFDTANPNDRDALERLFGAGPTYTKMTVEAKPVSVEAEQPPRKPGRPKTTTVKKPAEPETVVEEPTVEEYAEAKAEEPAAEEITKAMVAKELRNFLKERGEKEGPQAALAILKEFKVSTFPELKEEDYAAFLSKLRDAS